MYETHAREIDEQLKDRLHNFTFREIAAVRTATRGRASGGMIIGYKNELKNVICIKQNRSTVYLELHSMEMGVSYIVPQYLNGSKWDEDYETLFECLGDFDANKVMVAGDLNARIGKASAFCNFRNRVRNSKDEVSNNEGKKLIDLCNSFGLSIVNGCSDSDSEGEFTFIGRQGCSVIDYCLVGALWEDVVKDMKVDSQSFSDHLPLVIDLVINAREEICNGAEIELDSKICWTNAFKEDYCRMLDRKLETMEVQSLDDLDKLIRECAEVLNAGKAANRKILNAQQPWFDWQCYRARKNKFALLRDWQQSNDPNVLREYHDSLKNFNDMKKEKIELHEHGLAQKLCTSKDSADFWKTAKEIAGAKRKSLKPTIDAGTFKTHFQGLLNPTLDVIQFHTAWPGTYIEALDREISIDEINMVLSHSKDKKAPGVNRIPNEFYKYSSDTFKENLRLEFNRLFEVGSISQEYLKTIIFPIHKKGDKADPTNYRGISFQNAALKEFTGILQTRLMNWIDGNQILSPFQAGFRKGHSTVDQIFVLTAIVNSRLRKKEKLYAFFVDFKTAFDHVQRNLLFYKLAQKGLSFKFLRMIRALYENTTTCVWNGDKVSESFETKYGIKQGCNISPLLFSLFIDDLQDVLLGGIEFAGVTIKLLLYADDIVLIAKNPAALQLMINRLEKYCDDWGLTVNLNKSKAMVFRNGFGIYARNERWYYKGERIENVKEYTYLGFQVTPNLNFEKHLKIRAGEAKAALSITWKKCMESKCIKPHIKHNIYQTTSVMTLLYAAQCFGFKKSDTIEGVQRYYLKRSFKLPFNSPNYMLALETGLPDLSLTALKLHFDYIIGLVTNERDKLSKQVALYVVRKRTYWFEEWHRKATEVGMSLELNENNIPEWKDLLYELLNKLHLRNLMEYKQKAVESQSRTCYPLLMHELGESSYFNCDLSSEMVSAIFRIRGELINLNYMPHRADLPIYCVLCSQNEIENIKHFLGKCPNLQPIRNRFFHKNILEDAEIIEYLNGKDWTCLYRYYVEASASRLRVISQLEQ